MKDHTEGIRTLGRMVLKPRFVQQIMFNRPAPGRATPPHPHPDPPTPPLNTNTYDDAIVTVEFHILFYGGRPRCVLLRAAPVANGCFCTPGSGGERRLPICRCLVS